MRLIACLAIRVALLTIIQQSEFVSRCYYEFKWYQSHRLRIRRVCEENCFKGCSQLWSLKAKLTSILDAEDCWDIVNGTELEPNEIAVVVDLDDAPKNKLDVGQRQMDKVLAGLPFARCYIDDIVIWSKNLKEHLEHLSAMFTRLRSAVLKVHPGKCQFAVDKIDFLVHTVSAAGLSPQEEKVSAVRDLC